MAIVETKNNTGMFTQWFDLIDRRAEFKTAKTQLIGDPECSPPLKKERKEHTTKTISCSKRQCPKCQGYLLDS